MTCEHSETTAILVLFDEAPPWFAAHLAQCPDCQAVLAEHRETIDVITPHLPKPVPKPTPAPIFWRRRWRPVAAGMALAAAALLFVSQMDTRWTNTNTAEDGPALAFAETAAWKALDDELLSLEMELALMDLTSDTDLEGGR
ncbi:MAG: hypothetical protein AAFV53_11855 [Myxococcota bacterium]